MPPKLDWPTQVSLSELAKHRLPYSLELAIVASVAKGLDSYTSFMRALAGIEEDAIISATKNASRKVPAHQASGLHPRQAA